MKIRLRHIQRYLVMVLFVGLSSVALAEEKQESDRFVYSDIPLEGLRHMDAELDHLLGQHRKYMKGLLSDDEKIKRFEQTMYVYESCTRVAQKQNFTAAVNWFIKEGDLYAEALAEQVGRVGDEEYISGLKSTLSKEVTALYQGHPEKYNHMAYMCGEYVYRGGQKQIAMPTDFLDGYQTLTMDARARLDVKVSRLLDIISRVYAREFDEDDGGPDWRDLMEFSGRCYQLADTQGYEDGAEFFLRKSLHNPGVNWGWNGAGYGKNMARDYVERHPDEDNETAYMCSSYMSAIPADVS